MTPPDPDRARSTLVVVRRLVLFLLQVGFVGTFIELMLLGHYEEVSQAIPLGLIAAGVLTSIWTAVRPSALAVTLFRGVMVVLIVGAAIGLALHFRANMEFQRDLSPDAGLADVFWKVLEAKAPPALAPAVLGQLGCLGLIYAYRLPVDGR